MGHLVDRPTYGRRSTRSPLTTGLRRMFVAQASANARGLPVEAVLEELEGRNAASRPVSRRRFLAGAAAAGAGFALGPTATRAIAAARPAASGRQRRIAIVGAGLAGLRCGHVLWTRHGVRSTIYEGHADRIGGRCWSLRDYFSNGLITEHGGAFVDSNQFAALDLARELGLQLEDYNGGELIGLPEVYWFDGGYYTYSEASADWEAFGFAAFHAAVKESNTQAGLARLDRLSAPEWLDQTPIGTSSRFGRLMLANTVSENGGDPGEQSALDLIGLTGVNPRSSLDPLPGYDEKWHIVGGNDQLVHGMATRSSPASRGRNTSPSPCHSPCFETSTSAGRGSAPRSCASSIPSVWEPTRRSMSRSPRRRGRGTGSTGSRTPTGTASTSAGTTRCRSVRMGLRRCCWRFREPAPVATC